MATQIEKEIKKKHSWLWWILAIPILLIMAYLIFRAMWTISAMYYGRNIGYNVFKQNNIKVFTLWGVTGSAFQILYYGKAGTWNAATGAPSTGGWIVSFFYGLPYIWVLPYILFSPGFYNGLLNPGQPQTFE
jgi:hypothetical protein